MTIKPGRTRQRTNNLSDELIWGTTLGDTGWCIIVPIEGCVAVIHIFAKKRKYCNHRCPDSVYFNTLLLIIHLSTVKTLNCCREMSLIRSTSFGLAQNTIHDFHNPIELVVSPSSTNATKMHVHFPQIF